MSLKIVPTRRGSRLVQGDAVLSEVLSRPGPTHSVPDVLAACVLKLAPGPRFALLGFAGGAMVAPLRALDFHGTVRSVDLSLAGKRVFDRLSREWAGEVRVDRDEASRWLRGSRARFDVIIDDLSVDDAEGTTKPWVSIEVLPPLIRRRLAPGGVAVVNTLSVPGMSWKGLLEALARAYPHALSVTFERFENRLILGSEAPLDARDVSDRLRAALRALGSRLRDEFSVRHMHG